MKKIKDNFIQYKIFNKKDGTSDVYIKTSQVKDLIDDIYTSTSYIDLNKKLKNYSESLGLKVKK